MIGSWLYPITVLGWWRFGAATLVAATSALLATFTGRRA